MRLEYFSMLDRVVGHDAESLVAEATLPDASPVFEGHFPGFPLLPGVLMIECMAQAGGWLMLARQGFARMPLLAKVGAAKLRGMLRPGALLTITARLMHDGSGYAVLTGRIDSGGQMAAEAEFTLRTLPFPDEALAALVRGPRGRAGVGVSRVCITGVGLISSLGVGREAHLPLRARVLDEASFAPWPVHPMPALVMDAAIPRKEFRQMENFQRLGTYAAGLALADAGATGLVAGMDLVVAAGGGERDAVLDQAIQTELADMAPELREAHVHHRLSHGLRPTLFLAQLPNLLAGSISIVHGVAGSSRTLMGEEGAGAEAVRVAAARIAAGTSGMVLVGAASQPARWETLLMYAPFLHQGAWCPAAGRPGMVPGCQAAFLLLEDADHAAARGATVLARLRDVAVQAGPPAAAAVAGLNISPHAGPSAPGDEWLADALGAGLEAAFPVGIALAALRVAAGAPATPVHGFGHDYGAFSALVEPA